MVTLPVVIAACLTLAPFLAAAFFGDALCRWVQRLPRWVQLLQPALLCVPYVMVALSAEVFRWRWFLLYALVPVVVSELMLQARRADPEQRGNWRDFLILVGLGLAVDLKWLEPAWPAPLGVFNKMLLLDAGIYGFVLLRQLGGTGFGLRLRARDLAIGAREFALYASFAIVLGLGLGFLHVHAGWPRLERTAATLLSLFFFVAVPEELFFRGWVQNLLERRWGRWPALLVTAVIFGLSHFNKRALHFNWRYVVMAALAGIFYGRAWRQDRRVGASAVTHALVDTTWSLWLR